MHRIALAAIQSSKQQEVALTHPGAAGPRAPPAAPTLWTQCHHLLRAISQEVHRLQSLPHLQVLLEAIRVWGHKKQRRWGACPHLRHKVPVSGFHPVMKAVAAGSHCSAKGWDATSQQYPLSPVPSCVKFLSVSLGSKSQVTKLPTTSTTAHPWTPLVQCLCLRPPGQIRWWEW